MHLTDMTVQKLPVPERGQRLHPDDSLPGFGVRVSQGGSKTFVLIVGSRRERITIGRYPILSLAQARGKARQILAERQLGIVRKPSPAFRAVRDEYLAQRDARVRFATRRADDYLFKLFRALEQHKIADIDARDIEIILDGIDAPTTRRHSFIRLQGLFRFAIRRGYIERSPMERLDCPPDQEPRDRVLNDDELRRVLLTARAYEHAYGRIVELCALTGQRRQQIGSLHTKYIDHDARTITWPAEAMKTGRRHTIPYGAMTQEILHRTPPDPDGLYFPSRAGSGFVGWSYHKRSFDAACSVADFRLHDLRRTLATRWQEMGIEIATTERLLSHSAITGGLVGVYQRSTYLAQMRVAVERWEQYLAALLKGE